MLRRFVLSGLLGVAAFGALSTQDADLSGAAEAQAQQVGQPNDWQRFSHTVHHGQAMPHGGGCLNGLILPASIVFVSNFRR